MVSSWTFSSGVSILIMFTSGSKLSISGFGDSGFTVGVSDSLNSSIVADWPSVSIFIVSTRELGNPDEDEVVWVMLKIIITSLLRNCDFELLCRNLPKSSFFFEGQNDILNLPFMMLSEHFMHSSNINTRNWWRQRGRNWGRSKSKWIRIQATRIQVYYLSDSLENLKFFKIF